MRLDSMLDSLYVLGSLWGATGPQVCNSKPVPSFETRPAVSANVTAFVNVNVVPMDTERVLSHQTVLVEGGRITALGPAEKVQVPDGAVRIDGRGKYLMPGLANMHWHGFTGSPIAVQPESQRQAMQQYLFAALTRGITTLRSIEDPGPDQLLAFQRLSQKVPSPRLHFARRITKETKADSVAAFVATAKPAGYTHIGTPYSMRARTPESRAVFDSIVNAARRARLPLSVHSHGIPFEAALTLGPAGGSIEHPFFLWDSLLGIEGPLSTGGPAPIPSMAVSLSKVASLAAAVRRSGLWMTPTLRCIESVHGYITNLPALVKTMHDAGVRMHLSEDDGFDAHQELAALVRAGLSPYEALVTGTRNVAQFFGIEDSSGTVAVGKWADLVLLDRNPLADIRYTREPAGVMMAGRWLDRVALDQGLLASPTYWLGSVLRNRGNDEIPDSLRARRGLGGERGEKHRAKLVVLMDSLALTKPQGGAPYDRALRRFAAELGALRAIISAEEQRAWLDPLARPWLREQARQGHRVAIAGVRPLP